MTFAAGTVMEPRGLHGDSIYLVIRGTVAIVSLPEEEDPQSQPAAGPHLNAAAARKRSSSSKSENDFCLEGDMPGACPPGAAAISNRNKQDLLGWLHSSRGAFATSSRFYEEMASVRGRHGGLPEGTAGALPPVPQLKVWLMRHSRPQHVLITHDAQGPCRRGR